MGGSEWEATQVTAMVGGPSSEVGHSCNTALPLGPLSTSTPPHAVLLVLAPACEISMTVPRPGVERQKGPDLLSMSLRALALSRVSPSTSHSARRNTPSLLKPRPGGISYVRSNAAPTQTLALHSLSIHSLMAQSKDFSSNPMIMES